MECVSCEMWLVCLLMLNHSMDISANVSRVADTKNIFTNASSFNGDISQWDVSNVTSMTSMLRCAAVFNHDMSQWNASRVVGMRVMFDGAASSLSCQQQRYILWDRYASHIPNPQRLMVVFPAPALPIC